MNKEVTAIVSLGKDSLVQMALELVDEKVGVEYFAKIRVMTDGREVYVSFQNPVKYLPMNSAYYFDLNVSLLDQVTSYGAVTNGIVRAEEKPRFYQQTQETKENIQFVVDAINRSDATGTINLADFKNEMTIREQKQYYDITVISAFQESSYKIEKTSGKLYNVEHAQLVPPPFEDERVLMEIN
ncbi:hypothetical protein N6H18_10775 [Reichenbachiella agarivorans]|uniref:Uncharacterized protein n=1 Tax=Reichenbachiella agarivorans TaxID=2979464 RepID=A0ABY6CK00_9BACT|nr:hypothetical protein [Reichenbachiella agarivorans]UXP30836.1 hypothetical protein N6H18_10775 [Reichenbachiella agarivorans]